MADIGRFLKAGAILADDLRSINPRFSYTGTTIVKSPFGLARRFNGTSNVVDTRQSLIVGPKSFLFKLKINQLGKAHGVIVIDSSSSEDQTVIDITASNRMRFFGFDGSTAVGDTTGDNFPTDGLWHSCACVHNGTTNWKIYIDGVMLRDVTSTGVVTQKSNSVVFGRRHMGVTVYFLAGDLKDVVIFDRVVDLVEIQNYHLNKNFDYDKNIISMWNLDTTSTASGAVKDLGWKGSNNNGTVVGTSTLDDNPFGGACLSFSGTANYVNIPNNIVFPNNELTASIWFKTTNNTAADKVLFGKYDLNSKRVWNISQFATNNFVGFTTSHDGALRVGTMVSTATAVNDGVWHHVVGVSNGTTNVLYLDGVFIGSASMSGLYNVSDPTLIGGVLNTGVPIAANYFVGCISKPMIFDKALSALEVRDLYERTRSGLI